MVGGANVGIGHFFELICLFLPIGLEKKKKSFVCLPMGEFSLFSFFPLFFF